MGPSDSRPFANEAGVCAGCGRTWPTGTMSCPSCGSEIGGKTAVELNDNTTGEFNVSRARALAPSARELPAFADSVTPIVRKPIVAEPEPAPAGGGSSDPPTRLLRGFEPHIELPSGSVVDDYEIEAKVGEGAMGIVYRAKHVKLGQRVAIKVIAPRMGDDPQALARFEREGRALASLHHPNIVDVSAFGTLPDQRSYFVMEYLVGETLHDQLARERMPFDDAIDVVDQIAGALEGAHAQGIVHRDLKPSNTFLVRLPDARRTVVKLLDFGLAKLAVADGVEKTESGAVIGTALYLSPEQARGPNVDGRTDVYALGCIAYELVLGRHPFPDVRTPTAALAAHLIEPPPRPKTIWPEIPGPLDRVLFAMLAKDPSHRPTLAVVRDVIARVRSPATAGRATRAESEPIARRAILSLPAIVGIVGAVGLVVGVAIAASPLGGEASGDRGPPIPVGVHASEAPPPDPHAAAVAALPEPDAAVALPDAGTARSTKPRTTVTATLQAAVPDGPAKPAPLARDAGTMEKAEVAGPAVDATLEPAAVIDATVPSTTVSPVHRMPAPKPKVHPVEANPHKPRPHDRDMTVNPFRKKEPAP